jgi:hypothetical protein
MMMEHNMARIRSALEIVLEKTESVVGDPEKIRKSELEKTGKRLMGTYLFDIDADIDSLKKQYETVPEADRSIVREQMVETLLNNISLPQDDLYVQALGKVKKAAEFLSESSEEITELFVQIDQMYQQYLQSRDQLLDMAKQQYEPHLKRKQQQMSQQMGRQVTLQAEQDPDFIKFLESNYKHLEESFQEGVEEIRKSLRELITA